MTGPNAAWKVRAVFPEDTQAPFREAEWTRARKTDQGVGCRVFQRDERKGLNYHIYYLDN